MNYQNLFNLFKTATKELKYPTIRFKASTGENIQLFYAFKGYIGIKIDNQYSGKITAPGNEKYYFRMYTGNDSLIAEIDQFCLNPLFSAKINGQRYNTCCFCGLELTNKASVQSGYGPICAAKWGLPWLYKEEPLASLDVDNDATIPLSSPSPLNACKHGSTSIVCSYCDVESIEENKKYSKFLDARIAYIENRAKQNLPSPSRDELAAFADGYNAKH